MPVWEPDREAELRGDVTIANAPLPRKTGGAVAIRYGDDSTVILIDPTLIGPARRDALAHELIHHDRGGGAHGAGWERFRPDRIREERRVNRIVAERLIPTMHLQHFCDQQADLGHGVGPAEVMAEFEVSRAVAEQALHNLNRLERGDRP